MLQFVEPVSSMDTITNYFYFLADSLNPFPVDSTFKFELREIVLPDSSRKDTVSIRPSLLHEPNAPGVVVQPASRYSPNYDFIGFSLIIILVLLAWSRHFYQRRLKQIVRAFYAPYFVNQLMRDGNLVRERITAGLGMIYVIATATLAFGLIIIEPPFKLLYGDGLWFYLILVAGITLFWLLKVIFIGFTGKLFGTSNFASEFIITIVIFNLVAGLFSFVLIFAWIYTGEMLLLYITLGLFILIYSYRFLRLFMVGMKVQSFSVVYLFLYLCTLEILPVLILAKLLNLLG
ncbi:hypothetical protein MASR1M74_07540 [Lentimicrobium sp.]